MEVLVYEDTKEVESNFAVEDDLSSVIVKKKRRVSFAQTQTIHVIPRHDDIETPPLLNSDPLSGKSTTPNSASELANPRVFAEQQSATPRPSVADNSMDFSHFTSDMDTGHGSWADEDFPSRRNSFVGLEDDSGCFVHLGHISCIEDDDSIVNEVFNDDMTMDATTFTKNLSQYLNSGTTFDLRGAGHSGQALNSLNDCDTRSEDDSMALTKTGAPHWALINPQDGSMHADDDQSDMSLATESDRVRATQRRNSLAANKFSFPNTAEHPTPGFAGKSTSFSNKEKENLAPRNFQDGLSSNPPRLVLDPHCDSDISMSLTNTMHTSFSQSCPRQSLVLTKIDGNSQTPPTSRRRSDTILQDISLSVNDLNTTLPIRNLKDLLLDHTDYTFTRKIHKEAEFLNGKISDSYSLRPNGPSTVSSVKQEHIESQGSDLAGLHASEKREDRSHVIDDQTEEENVVQLPATKLQTLSDYLQFSCSVQPQMDWLTEHIQELEVKLQNAKKRNTEIKTCDASAQKLLEESPHTLKAKFASKHRLAKKSWILWKLDAKRKVLSWLQESKDNLMKEVEAAEMKGQQVLHTKVLYSQIATKMEINEPSLDLSEEIANLAATKKTAQISRPHQGEEKEREARLQSTELENRHDQYQEACNQLSDLTSNWNKLQIKIQSITSAHSHMQQTERENTCFEDNLKASMRKLELINSLLQQQQVMHLSVKKSGRTSTVKFSLGGMYFQSFQFGDDNWSSQVQIYRSLHPEAIEMAFPCMEAPSFFQYLHSVLQCMASVELQHLYRIIQKTNQLLGSLMDVLEEINFCRRNFGISCKFQILNGEPLFNMTFLPYQSGVRVILTFDMTGVKGGTYPFDLKPADIQIQTYGSPGSIKVITRTDMLSRIAKIQHGYGRLAKICTCLQRAMHMTG